ncbi:hypothetical protein [Sporocytophaga myxococcoides]|uniref:hypothetical protein n=1 Tax=Sporocytophaga myxococcoides TaxID=153721 RepID=UPI00041F2C77|nr:hypothetical protein [Sporocytophaga myxococcoides]
MKSNIFLPLLVIFISFQYSFAQKDIEDLKNKVMSLDLSQSWRINSSSDKIILEFTDTMELCGRYDLSPLRLSDTSATNTYKVELSFENTWTKKRIKLTQKRNEELIAYIKARIIRYGDSLNWKMPKTDKQSILDNPMSYLYVVKNWSESDKQMIAQIKPLPTDLINRVGVFINVNTLCVMPERKNTLIGELHSALLKLGIHVPANQTQLRDKNESSF